MAQFSVDGNWKQFFDVESQKGYFQPLKLFIENEYSHPRVTPCREDIFRAFELTKDVPINVVVLGLDPHPNPAKATGVAFSLPPDVPVEPKDNFIQTIFSALEEDVPGFERPNHGCLEGWARQGVLLLNSLLTFRPVPNPVRGNPRNLHDEIYLPEGLQGWETFTRNLIQFLCSKNKNLVFLLWGNKAQSFSEFISGDHRVLTGPHPAAMGYEDAYIPLEAFTGQHFFSRTNEYLQQYGKSPINWKNMMYTCIL